MIKNLKKAINNIKNEYIKSYNNIKNKNDETTIFLISKIKNYENNYQLKLIEIEKKYQKYLSEQIRLNNKLERENKDLISEKNNNNIKSRDLLFKKIELENEIKNYISLNEKLKLELDNKNNEYEAISNKNKLMIKSFRNHVNNLILTITKLKKKYQSDIYLLKSQINDLIQLFENNIIKKDFEIKNYMKNKINQIYRENQKSSKSINLLNQEIIKKDKDNYNLKEAYSKLKISYNNIIKKPETSEKILNGKVIEKDKIKNNINQNLNK